MPKKLVLSSIALHAAALAMAIIAAIMYLARDFADIPFWIFFDRYQIYLYALVIGTAVYLADIVLLAKAYNRGIVSDSQTSALYASVVGDLCMAFCVFPLFINHPALVLGIAAECLIVTNFVLRMNCTLKLASIARERSSENRDPVPAVKPPVTLSPKEKKLSLAAAFAGLACIVLGIALFCVVFRIRILSNAQSTDADSQIHSNYLIDIYLYNCLSRFLSFSLYFICTFQDGDEGTIFGHPRNHNYSLGHERTHDSLFLIYYISSFAQSRHNCHGRPALLG